MAETTEQVNDNLREACGRKIFPVRSQEPSPPFNTKARLPANLRPCFELRWGDSRRDEIETDDQEVLCIVASNPYANVTFKDLTVVTIVTQLREEERLVEVPKLPDGTPSVDISPSYIIYFGVLAPYDPALQPTEPPEIPEDPDLRDRELRRRPLTEINPAGVAREVVLLSRGARSGDYTIRLEYMFSVEFTLDNTDDFHLELVES